MHLIRNLKRISSHGGRLRSSPLNNLRHSKAELLTWAAPKVSRDFSQTSSPLFSSTKTSPSPKNPSYTNSIRRFTSKPEPPQKLSQTPPPPPPSNPSTASDPKLLFPLESTPRWPDLSPGGVLRSLDYFGTAVFAVTGSALAGTISSMDLLGCTIVGSITALGGGTIRDFLLRPTLAAFWLREPEYLVIAATSAIAAFFLVPDHPLPPLATELADAVSLGAFAIIGTQTAVKTVAIHPLPAIILGSMATATFGGVVRDVLAGRPPRIMHSHQEIYAGAAVATGAAYAAAGLAGAGFWARLAVGLTTAVAVRMAAVFNDVKLMVYKGADGTRGADGKKV